MFQMYGVEKIYEWVTENAVNISRIVFAAYLFLLAFMDIHGRKLHLGILLTGIPLAVISRVVLGNIPAALVISGAAAGALFMIISRVTEEAFGYGDSILIMIMGIFLGIWDLLLMLVTAFFLAAVFSTVMLAGRYYTRKSSFPFVPFLTAAYIGGMLIGGYV